MSDPSVFPASRRGAVAVWLMLFLALAGVYWAIATLGPSGFGIWQDDAVYVVTAKSLAQGTGYRHLEMPSQPLQTKYPPFFPALLSAVWRISDDWPANLSIMRAIVSGSLALVILLAWRYFRKVLNVSPCHAIVLIILTATSPLFISMNRFLMSELPYTALTLAALFVLDRRLIATQDRRSEAVWSATAGLLILCIIFTRTIGVSLAAGGVLMLLWRRKWWAAAWITVIVAAGVLAYGAWQHFAAIANGSLQSTPLFSYGLDYGLWCSATPTELVRVMWQNAWRTVLGAGVFLMAYPADWVFPALQRFGGATLGLQIWCVLVTGAMVAGFISSLHRRLTIHLYVFVYLLMMLVWPFDPYRFLIPLIPFSFYFLLQGGLWLTRSLMHQPRLVNTVLASAAVLLMVLSIVENAKILTGTRESYYIWVGQTKNLDQLDELAGWIRCNTPAAAVLASPYTADLHLSTGRKFVEAWVTDDPVNEEYGSDRSWWNFYAMGTFHEVADVQDRMRKHLWEFYRQAGVDYCIWDSSTRNLAPIPLVAREQPDRFRRVFVSSRKTLAVFKVLSSP